MRSLERKGPWPQSRAKPGTPSKLLLRWESSAAEGDAQQGPPPSQGGDWTQQNMQGPQVSPQLLL